MDCIRSNLCVLGKKDTPSFTCRPRAIDGDAVTWQEELSLANFPIKPHPRQPQCFVVDGSYFVEVCDKLLLFFFFKKNCYPPHCMGRLDNPSKSAAEKVGIFR